MNKQVNNTTPIIIRDNEQRAKNVIIAFWVLMVVNLIAVVSGYLQVELLQVAENGGYYTDNEASVNDLREDIIRMVQSINLILLAVLFIMWFRRAYVNAGSISDRKLNHDDSWAIWGFVVPIISWWYPYIYAAEINEKMDRFLKGAKTNYIPISIGWAIGLWWAFYLISNVIINFTILSLNEDTIEELITATEVYIFSDLFDILAALVTVIMILKMSEKEKIVKETVAEINKTNAIIKSNTTEEE